MLRILLFLFTLNTLLLPISGYAGVSMSDSISSEKVKQSIASTAVISKTSSMNCNMPNPCLDCDMNNMDPGCGLDCSTHCLGTAATLPDHVSLPLHAAISTRVISSFKHFYLHTFSPEVRPPLA